MKYVRFLVVERVEKAPRVIKEAGGYIANPTEETLAAHGYKPLEETAKAGECPAGHHWEPRYVELEDKVVMTWQAVEGGDEPEPETTDPGEPEEGQAGEHQGNPTPSGTGSGADGGEGSGVSSASGGTHAGEEGGEG